MATLADVARHAGVAASTVSYVLSGKRPVSEETRERVARSIQLLGYQPHAGARALASAKSNVLGLVMPLRRGKKCWHPSATQSCPPINTRGSRAPSRAASPVPVK